MSAVWISRESWLKVWSALHNIRVRCSHTVKTPCASISGVGASARINIDLPADYGSADAYDGPFAVSYDDEAKKLKIAKGFRNVNGVFAEVPEAVIEPAEGTLCLHLEMGDATGEISAPEFRFVTPSASDYPIAKIKADGGSWIITQYCVTVAVYMFGRECIYAKNKGSIDG